MESLEEGRYAGSSQGLWFVLVLFAFVLVESRTKAFASIFKQANYIAKSDQIVVFELVVLYTVW